MMLTVALLTILTGLTTALDPTYRPGSILHPSGDVYFINEYLAIIIDMNETINIPSSLTVMHDELIKIEDGLEIRTSMNRSCDERLTIQAKIHLERCKETVTETLSWFPKTYKSSRVKRGLINLVGTTLSYLFGTATTSEVQKLNERFTTLECLTKTHHKVLHGLLSDNIDHTNKINEMIHSMNNITDNLKKVQETQEACTEFIYTVLLIQNIYAEVKQYSLTLREHIDEITLASRDIVTTKTISIADLQRVLQKAKIQFGLQPLFSLDELSLYYSFMNIHFTPGSLVLRIPMKSEFSFIHVSFIPFPTWHKNTTIILETNYTELLLSHDNQQAAMGNAEHFKDCKSTDSKTICPANVLPISPRWDRNSCLEQLYANTFNFQDCIFQEVKVDFQLTTLEDFAFIFSEEARGVITCPGEQPQEIKKRNIKVKSSCGFFNGVKRVVPTNQHLLRYAKKVYEEWESNHNITRISQIKVQKIDPIPKIRKIQEEKNISIIVSSSALGIGIFVPIVIIACLCYIKNRQEQETVVHQSAHL